MTIPKCKKHKQPMVLVLVTTGGCQGHFGEGDRCYCDNQDVHAEFHCITDPYNTNCLPNRWCTERVKIVEGLTDLNSIERWISARINKP